MVELHDGVLAWVEKEARVERGVLHEVSGGFGGGVGPVAARVAGVLVDVECEGASREYAAGHESPDEACCVFVGGSEWDLGGYCGSRALVCRGVDVAVGVVLVV